MPNADFPSPLAPAPAPVPVTPAPDTLPARVRAAILTRVPERWRPAAEALLLVLGAAVSGLLARYGF